MKNSYRLQRGFNLIELMLTLAILAILVGMAAPSFNSMLDRRAVQAETSRIVRSINLARSKAVTGGTLVTMERTSATAQDWASGWQIFVDDNGIVGAYDPANDELVSTITIESRAISLLSDADAASRISFNPQGRLVNPEVQFAVCDEAHSTGSDGSLITVSTTGRVSISAIPAATKAAGCVLP